jgi:trigger factor
LDTLRTRIGQQIKFRKEMANRDDQRKQIGEKLGTAVEFAVPESLIESESQALLSRFMEDNIRRGVAYEAFEKNKEKLVADARGAAGRTAKLRMILQRIAEQENIRLENADIERYIVNEARRTNQRPDQFAKELGKDQDRVRQMQLVLLLDKTLDFVVTQATVVPVPATA